MAPIFKTSSGLPLSVYIEPSSSNRPVLHKSIMSNGGASVFRIDKANVILVDAQSPKGRACAREQLASGTERIVLFVEWVDACISAGKLLGSDLDWGNLRIQDPEILDESLYEDESKDSKTFAAHVKADVKEEDRIDSKNHRPWPTPTSPAHLPQGELPVMSQVPSRTTATPPLAKTEPFDPIPALSHYTDSPQLNHAQRPASLSPFKSSKTPSPFVPNYGRPPAEPEYDNLFLSACEEWENIKKEAATHVPPPKRRSQSFGQHVSLDRPSTKSPRHALSQEQRSRSPDVGSIVYQPLAKKRRPPLPAGSTKRGPKRRVSDTLAEGFTSSQLFLPEPTAQPVGLDVADDSDGILEIPPPQSQLQSQPSTSLNPKRLFTYSDEPMQFSVQTDLPNRGAIIRLIRKHGGETASRMEDASYIIVSKSTPQYQEFVQEARVVDRPAVPVAWINRCIEENRIVSTEGFAVDSGQRVGSTLTEEDIIKAAMADAPPEPAPRSSWVKNYNLGYKFTQLDQEYLQKSLAWTYARDSGFLLSEFIRKLAQNSPNHPFNSWNYYYYRSSTDVNRVLNIVATLKS
ncbi:hypothetical protein OPQ81_010132 [Rhizoctonia solani]|nr:hypothetical protein OPQ81_010132 [Rhizoctonia solani]